MSSNQDPRGELLRELLGYPPPSTVNTPTLAAMFGVSNVAVLQRIAAGDLPATKVLGSRGQVLEYQIDPRDALLLWGRRLERTESADA